MVLIIRDNKVVELYRCGVACNNSRSEAVYYALQNYVADGDKALLEYARHGDSGNPFQKIKGERRRLPVGFNFLETPENEENGKNTAYSLTDEGCPRNTRNSHFKPCDKEYVGGNVRNR